MDSLLLNGNPGANPHFCPLMTLHGIKSHREAGDAKRKEDESEKKRHHRPLQGDSVSVPRLRELWLLYSYAQPGHQM